MKKIFLLIVLALTFVSCGSSSSSTNSISADYANEFTAEEVDKIEDAYLIAHNLYDTQYLFLTLVVGSQKMTFVTTQSTGHSNYDASYENKVYLSKENNKFIVTENSTSVSYNTIDTALENCF